MSTREEITALLAEWGRLSQSEGAAIQAASWNRVKEIQTAKEALRKPISAALQKWRAEDPSAAATPIPFQHLVAPLLSLENRNRNLVAAQKNRVRTRLDSIQQTRHDLRRIRSSYGKPAHAGRYLS